MRHADSYPTDFSGYENERPINVVGLLQIEQVINSSREMLQSVDFVLCSGVKRAKQTFHAIYQVVPSNMKFMFDDCLLQNTSSELLAKIQWTPAIYNKILIIGHNPLLQQFVAEVAPSKDVAKFETCEFAVLESDVKSWQEVNYNVLQIKTRMKPEIKESIFDEENKTINSMF